MTTSSCDCAGRLVMRSRSIALPLSAGLLLAFLGSGVARAEEAPSFPVMAWDAPPNDPVVLQKMRECGFTVAGFVTPAGLDNCHAEGLKAIVFDPRTRDYDWGDLDAGKAQAAAKELVQEVRNHPAVFGYYLRDEPTAAWFPNLAVVADVVQREHPGAWPYINLFPNYAGAGHFGGGDYEGYVEKFVETCRPPILSYDHYALLVDGGLRPKYFPNLEVMRRVSRRHNLPFWNIVSSVAHFNYREVSPADFRFQVYTTLAYGARGIAYFTYFTPPVGSYRQGPIDQFGHPTATWSALRNVNLQIAKLAPTLLRLKSDRVYHFGDVPKGCHGPPENSLVATIDGPMLVGDFTHEDGSRYVMIVNKDVTAPINCRPKFRSPPASVQLISPYHGLAVDFSGEQTWLAPGQGVLLKLVPRPANMTQWTLEQ